jgi:hypothetical protein
MRFSKAWGGMKSALAILQFALAIGLFLCAVMPAHPQGVGLDGYGCHNNRRAGGYHCHRGPLAGQSFSSRKRCSRNCQQRILIEKSRQMLRSKAKSPSERKEPPTPKKPPIKEPKKVQKPIGDPPPKRAPKRVMLQGYFQDSIWQGI